MAAPVDLNISQPSIVNMPQPSLNGGVSAQTVSYKQQTATGKDLSERAAKQDTVKLSSEALDMSKELLQKRDVLAEQREEEKKIVKQQPARNVAVSAATIKHFPPFMGDSESLAQIKQSSPALYKEILKMMVPPPVNISYLDTQEIRNTDPAYRR